MALMNGGIFLVNKYFEWSQKIHHGIYPNSPDLLNGPPGRNIFFGLYYVITGLHGLHIIIGMVLLFVCAVMVHTKRINHGKYSVLENSGLYWHLVDIIWIFIFPLFYLII
jgi:cytochrome c oxidase subunit 3